MTLIIGPSGIEMDVEASIASGLVSGGHARFAVAQPAQTPVESGDPVTSTGEQQEGDEQNSDAESNSAAQPAQTPVEKPKGNAGLPEWTDYAKSQGVDVEGKSRDEIRALFKGE
jgi:hypothetical protein